LYPNFGALVLLRSRNDDSGLRDSKFVSRLAVRLGTYLVYATIGTIFAVFIWGAYLAGSGYGAACGLGGQGISSDSWPYCNGSLNFPSNWPAQVEYVHRALSVVATILLVWSNLTVWRMDPRPKAAAHALLVALVLLFVELCLGAVAIRASLDVVIGTISLATATSVFGVLVLAGDRMYLYEKQFRKR